MRQPADHGEAFAIYGGIAGAGSAVGLLLGGVLTEYLSWRWCLYVNLLFAVPALFAAAGLLHNEAQAAHARLDLPGVLTSGAGLFALVYGLTKVETDGWGAAITLGFLAAAVVLLAAFAVVQTRACSRRSGSRRSRPAWPSCRWWRSSRPRPASPRPASSRGRARAR